MSRVNGAVPAATSVDWRLAAELEILNLRLERQIARLRSNREFDDNPLRGLYLSDQRADAALANLRDAPAGADGLGAAIRRAERLRDERLQAGLDRESPLDAIAARFELEPPDIDLLVIGLAVEMHQRYETLYAYAQNDATRRRPTVGLALELLCEDEAPRRALRARLRPPSPLISHRLVELAEDPQEPKGAFLGRGLRIPLRIADVLLGVDSIEDEIQPYCTQTARSKTPGFDVDLSERVERAAACAAPGVVVELAGPAGSGRLDAALHFAALLGRAALCVHLDPAPSGEGQLEKILGLIWRERRLRDAVIVLSGVPDPRDPATAAFWKIFLRTFDPTSPPCIVLSEIPFMRVASDGALPVLEIECGYPAIEARQALWRQAAPEADTERLAELAGKYRLTAGRVLAAGEEARRLAAVAGGHPAAGDHLDRAARLQSTLRLSELARKVETPFDWPDLVLQAGARAQLMEIASALRRRGTVMERWGFERKLASGRGTNALFSGPSGAGKTMAASVIARSVGLDLYKIDLASVVSKYIGETEKNLARIFDQAANSNAMLFFDEADALFGKRSQVKDSHDRYANIEVAYLLQRIEDFDGVVILATNLKRSLDDAFARRIHHSVDFSLPDRELRLRLWKQMIPPEAPVAADIDWTFLATQFELSGGHIRNVALAAAYLAAEHGGAISMRHMTLAVARELQKIGRLPERSDFQQYFRHLDAPGRPQ